MKPNNAGKCMWLRAQTENEKFEQEAKTQDTGGMQAVFMLYMTKIDALSQQ